MVRMGLDEWENRHGIETVGTGTKLVTAVDEETTMFSDDFLSQSDVAGETVGRRKRRSMETLEQQAETASGLIGTHQSSRATENNNVVIDETARQTADKYIPRTADKPGRKRSVSRSTWASKISKAWLDVHEAAVSGIFQVGGQLIAAREALNDEEWEHMLANELPFGLRTVQRLMAVARDARLRAAANLLPASWGTLYELTKLSDSELDKLAHDGVLRPEMERREVSAARKDLRILGTITTIGEPARATRGEHLAEQREDREDREDREELAERPMAFQAPVAEPAEPAVQKPDARKVLQEIVTMIEMSQAPAQDTLAAVLILARKGL